MAHGFAAPVATHARNSSGAPNETPPHLTVESREQLLQGGAAPPIAILLGPPASRAPSSSRIAQGMDDASDPRIGEAPPDLLLGRLAVRSLLAVELAPRSVVTSRTGAIYSEARDGALRKASIALAWYKVGRFWSIRGQRLACRPERPGCGRGRGVEFGADPPDCAPSKRPGLRRC